MDNQPPQRESPVVLTIFAVLFLAICSVVIGISYIFATRSGEIQSGFETGVARPLVAARQTLTAAPRVTRRATGRVMTPPRRSGTFTPRPTIVPTPIAPVGWKTVIDEHFENESAGWTVGELNTGSEHVVREIASGAYNWSAVNPGAMGEWVAVPNMPEVADFFATVDVAGTPHAEVGFVFGYRDENNFARFVASRDGTYRAENQEDGEWLLLFKGFAVNEQATPPQQIAMKRHNGVLQFWLNDVPIASRPESSTPKGKVGLTVLTARGETVQLSFDNFQVQTP